MASRQLSLFTLHPLDSDHGNLGWTASVRDELLCCGSPDRPKESHQRTRAARVMDKEEMQLEFGLACVLGILPVVAIAFLVSENFSQAGFVIAFAALIVVIRTLLFQYVLGVFWEKRNVIAGAFTIAACVFGMQFVPYGSGIVLIAAILTFIGRRLS